MSLQDGKWDYEPEVLTLLNDMMDKEPFEVIRAVESNRKGLVFNGIIMQFQLRLHMSPDKAVKRINYWMKWRTCVHKLGSSWYHSHSGPYVGPQYEHELDKARALVKKEKTNG